MIKNLFNCVLMGAGLTLGGVLVKKGYETVTDPYKKQRFKNKFNKIKDAIKG